MAKISIKYVLPTSIWKFVWRISRYFAFWGEFRGISWKYLNFAGPRLREISEALEKVSFPVIEAILSLKQSIFWNVGRTADFVDWNIQRDWYIGSRNLIFLKNRFFWQSLTYTTEIYE